jgi:hypothetical protein
MLPSRCLSNARAALPVTERNRRDGRENRSAHRLVLIVVLPLRLHHVEGAHGDPVQ